MSDRRTPSGKDVTRDELLRQTGRGATKPYAPTAGDRFGELTLIRVAEIHRGNRIWECLCDCGAVAIRSTSSLTKSVRDGQGPACRACNAEAAVGRRVLAEDAKGRFWAALYRKIGTVWPDASQDRLARRVADALDDEGHRSPTDVPMTMRAYGYETYEPREQKQQQQAAYLYPIDGRGKAWWMCIDCRKPFPRGFGCVQCIEPTCVECVRGEHHLCGREEGMTLGDVGRFVFAQELVAGVYVETNDQLSRERIRGIQERALRKLRSPRVLRELAA